MRVSDSETQFVDKAGLDHAISELKAYIDGVSTGSIDLSDYVTKNELQAKLDALDINIDLSSYATKEELTNAINNIDLSAYAKKTDIPSLDGYAKTTDIPTVPTKVSELENDSGYLTEHQDLSAYALKTEIPSTDGLATTEYVDNAIANVPTGGNVDLSNYYTKEETDALIPSTEGLATEEYVDNAINSIPTTDLSNYYTKDETYSKTEVDTLVANSGGSSSGGSSGGASGITYAYDTEIATGDTWIDGKPIYLRIFHIDGGQSTSYSIDVSVYHKQDKFADSIVSVIPMWKSDTRSITGNIIDISAMVSNVTNANENIVQRTLNCWVENDTKFSIYIAKGKRVYYFACDVFVKYTKLS